MTLRQGDEGKVSRNVSIALITQSGLPDVNLSTNFTEMSLLWIHINTASQNSANFQNIQSWINDPM